MPPKKKEDSKKKVVLGRVGTNLKMGIVGLPNVGKSTFFNILTNSKAAAESFPFCTIDPNESRVPVPDARFDWLVNDYKPVRKEPAYLNITDIAGLVKGAHEGQGLGNEFLSHIKSCDGIFHMIRLFSDEEIAHVEGDLDPIRDMEIIHEELRLKDLELIRKAHDDMAKRVTRGADKALKQDFDVICKILSYLDEKKMPVRFAEWTEKEIEVLNRFLLITSKPMIYLINMAEKDYLKKKNKWLAPIKSWLTEHDPDAVVIPFSAMYELKLSELSDEERNQMIESTKAPSVLDKIIVQGYKALNLIYFFTVGKDEVKCWTIQQGTKAPQAAGKIHTDFERGFIMAEVMKFDDLKEFGNENAVKTRINCEKKRICEGARTSLKAAGRYRQQGKNYVVEDGDIILIKANTGAGLSKK